MKIAIVDDERPARSELAFLIREIEPDTEIMEADSGESFLDLLRRNTFDACFVDINMGDISGTALASLIKNIQPDIQIVFATAYREYAVKAFELGAVDYVMKPFDAERLKKTLNRLRDWSSPVPAIDKVMLYNGTEFQVVEVRDIIYIESDNRGCLIHTAAGNFQQNETLNAYEQKLRQHQFFRIHKSYLINLDAVVKMVPGYNNGYNVVLRGYEKNELPIGRTQLKEFRQRFGK